MDAAGRAAHFPYLELRGVWMDWLRAVQGNHRMFTAADVEGVILASVLGRDLYTYGGHREAVGQERMVDPTSGQAYMRATFAPRSREVLDLQGFYRGFVTNPAQPGVTRDPYPLRIYYNGINDFEAIAPTAWAVQYDYGG